MVCFPFLGGRDPDTVLWMRMNELTEFELSADT